MRIKWYETDSRGTKPLIFVWLGHLVLGQRGSVQGHSFDASEQALEEDAIDIVDNILLSERLSALPAKYKTIEADSVAGCKSHRNYLTIVDAHLA